MEAILVSRDELLDYGVLPINLLLPQLDSLASLQQLHRRLLTEAEAASCPKGMITEAGVTIALNVPEPHCQLLLRTMAAVRPARPAPPAAAHDLPALGAGATASDPGADPDMMDVSPSAGGGDANTFGGSGSVSGSLVPLHELLLFLLVQLYAREAHKPETQDHWPEFSAVAGGGGVAGSTSPGAAVTECFSPTRHISGSSRSGAPGSPGSAAAASGSTRALVKAQALAHQRQHQAYLRGLHSFLQRHPWEVLDLVLDAPLTGAATSNGLLRSGSGSSSSAHGAHLAAAAAAAAGQVAPGGGGGNGGGSSASSSAQLTLVPPVSAAELNRLSYLLRPAAAVPRNGGGGGGGAAEPLSGVGGDPAAAGGAVAAPGRLLSSFVVPALVDGQPLPGEVVAAWLARTLPQPQPVTTDAAAGHPGAAAPGLSPCSSPAPGATAPITAPTPSSPNHTATAAAAAAAAASSPLGTSPPGATAAATAASVPLQAAMPGLSRIRVHAPRGVVAVGAGAVDERRVAGVYRGTVVRGDADVARGSSFAVQDCTDCVVYVLAPLRFAVISGCTDCTVVIGAVGSLLRVEACERVTVIAAAAQVTAISCHSCTLHLGTPQPPALLGDNRFVTLAPYNTCYEGLASHLEAAGIPVGAPSLWNLPLVVAGRQGGGRRAASAAGQHSTAWGGGGGNGGANGGTNGGGDAPKPVLLMAPGELLPFVVPFKGTHGSLAGGAASSSSWASATTPRQQQQAQQQQATPAEPASQEQEQLQQQATPQLSPLEGGPAAAGAEGAQAGAQDAAAALQQQQLQAPPLLLQQQQLFPLPPDYDAALASKYGVVAALRSRIRSAVLEESRRTQLQGVIQAYFREWLNSSGVIRQVYDLSKLEAEEVSLGLADSGGAAGRGAAGGSSSGVGAANAAAGASSEAADSTRDGLG